MSSSAANASTLVTWLRAAGETTRLRLLALCAERDLSVSDLAMALRQSEPRVSRHLKILSAAGLIERLRHGQWVHYQVVRAGAMAAFVQGLIAQLDRTDPVFMRDRESLCGAGKDAPLGVTAQTRLGRALRAFLATGGARKTTGSVLIIGLEHPEILTAIDSAQQRVAIARSRRAAQAARALAEREGLSCRVLTGAQESISARDTERAGRPFDAIVLERLAPATQDLSQDLAVARQALVPGGRLWLFAEYESFESPPGRLPEHPLGKIRRILSEAGFVCEQLSPIEADGEHLLAASAIAAQESNMRVA